MTDGTVNGDVLKTPSPEEDAFSLDEAAREEAATRATAADATAGDDGSGDDSEAQDGMLDVFKASSTLTDGGTQQQLRAHFLDGLFFHQRRIHNDWQYANQKRKVLPGLVCQMSDEGLVEWNVPEGNPDSDEVVGLHGQLHDALQGRPTSQKKPILRRSGWH